MAEEKMKKFAGEGPHKGGKAIGGCMIEASVIAVIVYLHESCINLPQETWTKVLITVAVLILSNLATTWIVGWYKDYYLWRRAGPHKDNGREGESLKVWWKENNKASNFSGILGFIERIVVALPGIVSFNAYFLACGGWLTLKTAIEWNVYTNENTPRVISHIYLISSVLSLAMAAIDVAFIRLFWGLSLL